jgi:hypothetical protein
MQIIVTKQNPNGTYDEVGMNNRALFSQYKTISGAIRYGAKPYANGKPCRVEFFTNVYADPFKVIYINGANP